MKPSAYQTKMLLPVLLFAMLGIMAVFCSSPLKNPLEQYKPPAVFTGFVSGDWDSLPGNRDWKNLCYLAGDTVRMRFYSENFSRINDIPSGDFLRMDLLPCTTCVRGIMETRHVILHVARYQAESSSYEITPADSLSGDNDIALHVRGLSRRPGAAIEIDSIEATAKAMTGSAGLRIKSGRISGTIQ